jgi:mannosyl-oligosaccharide alpha-1,2-mannosidase
MYLAAIDGMEKLLLNQSTTGHTYIGDFDLVTKTPVARLAHLACFVPGLLALGADRLREEDPLRSERHLKIAKQLMETCYKDLYLQQPSRLSPEYVQGPLLQPPPFSGYSAGYKLRPEVVESLYVMHQLTGDSIYQEWGWQIFTAIDRNCRTLYGYTQYLNVQEEVVWSKDPQERAIQTARLLENKMETFFPAETLKYLYLLFDVDNRHVRLDTHVFNTEAHPLSIFRD